MEGVSDEMSICNLSSRQMGVLYTFQPASFTYIYDVVLLANVRKSFLFIIKELNSAISVEDKNAWSNVLQVNIYLQSLMLNQSILKLRNYLEIANLVWMGLLWNIS